MTHRFLEWNNGVVSPSPLVGERTISPMFTG